MLRLVGLVIFIAVSCPVLAEERGKQRADVCDQDSSSCRGLALEVAKAAINDAINDARIMAREGSFLCPADNPQCCPPHLRQMCGTFRAETVAVVQAQLLHSAKSKKCPFVESICDMLAGKYCNSIEETYTPWSGCTVFGGGVVGPSCPFGTVPSPNGNCQPWPPCPLGKKHNSKGICIPEPCYFEATGTPIPCNYHPGNAGVVAHQPIPTNKKPPARFLVENLNDRSLRLEAATQVLEDLKASISLVEEQINRLAQ